MIASSYILRLQSTIRKHLPAKDFQVFIFGSAIKQENFRDIDVGIIGDLSVSQYRNLQEELEESTFPYIVDLVDLKNTDPHFSDFVLYQETKQWL